MQLILISQDEIDRNITILIRRLWFEHLHKEKK